MATAGLPLWSTTASSNGNADPAVNFAEGMAPSAVNDSARALMASVAKWRDDLYGTTSGLSTGGTSTAYTVDTNSTYATAAAMSGAILTIIPHTTSGAAPTLAVDGLPARALNVSTGVAIPTGALISGTPYFVRYLHASTEFIVVGAGIKPLSGLDIIGGTSLTAIATDDTLPIYDLSGTANKRILISDVLKVINLLSADSTPDSAADYLMTYDTSATAAKKVLLADIPSALPRGYIDGCELENGSDATNDINVKAGVCRDSTNTRNINVPAITGKQLDANWAAGGSAGMRNSAAGIANGTYHIWAGRTGASATGDIYAHTSADAATVLAAWQAETGGSDIAYVRRIGSIIRESGSIVGFVQVEDEFLRKVPKLSTSSTPTTSAADVTLDVPTGIIVRAIINTRVSETGTSALAALLYSKDMTDAAASSSAAPGTNVTSSQVPEGFASTGGGQMVIRTDTAGKIRWVATTSTDAAIVITVGWFDRRGRGNV